MFFSQESLKVEYEIVTQSKINLNDFLFDALSKKDKKISLLLHQ